MDTRWLFSAGLVTSSIIAVTANAFLLIIFCRRRGLRTVPNRFVINLLITNLLSSLLLVPLLVLDQTTHPLSNETEVSTIFLSAAIENERSLCYVAQISTSFVCTLSIFSILLIGINQYFGVIHSLRYHAYINKCRSTVFILTTWLMAFVFSAMSSATHSDSIFWGFCRNDPPLTKTLNILNSVYTFSYAFLIILVPFVAICVIYVCIYRAAHKNTERMRKSTSTNLDICYKSDTSDRTLPKIRSAPNFMRLEDSVTSSNLVTRTNSDRTNFITTIRHKISNASVFKYRVETRAAKISILVIFLVLICYVPYGVVLVLNSTILNLALPPKLNFLAVVLLALSNTISPFLFGYRNKRVKREIGKVFGFRDPSYMDAAILNRRRSANDELTCKPFLGPSYTVPEVIVTCKIENEKKSILKRVCQSSTWSSYKKCNFITVPESCLGGDARGSFSSASTQISNEDC